KYASEVTRVMRSDLERAAQFAQAADTCASRPRPFLECFGIIDILQRLEDVAHGTLRRGGRSFRQCHPHLGQFPDRLARSQACCDLRKAVPCRHDGSLNVPRIHKRQLDRVESSKLPCVSLVLVRQESAE